MLSLNSASLRNNQFKKIVLLLSLFCISLSINSQEFSGPKDISSFNFSELTELEKSFKITHSVSPIIDPGTSVSCNLDGVHFENSYYRVFDLQNEFNLNGNWLVQNVEIGIAQAISGSGNAQAVNIFFYVMSEYNNTIILDSLTQKGDTLKFEVFNNESGSLKNLEVSPNVNVNLGQVLVVEVRVPDGQVDGHSFFIGSNDLGESDSTYILADHCGINTPVPMSDILFPDMHMIMNLYGVYENPIPELLSFQIEGQIIDTEIINDPDWKVNIVMPLDTGLNALAPLISIPAGFQVIPASGELVDFSAGSVQYEVNNEIGKVSQIWEVSVTNAGPDILDVQVSGQNGETVINKELFLVSVPVPFETDLSDIVPDITIFEDEGFIIDPESGISQDFSAGPVIYTVSHTSLPLEQDWEISVYESEGSGIKDFNEKELSIYPNPADDFLQLNFENIDKIEIYDIHGSLISLTNSAEDTDIRTLADGIYVLKIYLRNHIYTKKLIIAH